MAQLNKKLVDSTAKSVKDLNDEIIRLNKSYNELLGDVEKSNRNKTRKPVPAAVL